MDAALSGYKYLELTKSCKSSLNRHVCVCKLTFEKYSKVIFMWQSFACTPIHTYLNAPPAAADVLMSFPVTSFRSFFDTSSVILMFHCCRCCCISLLHSHQQLSALASRRLKAAASSLTQPGALHSLSHFAAQRAMLSFINSFCSRFHRFFVIFHSSMQFECSKCYSFCHRYYNFKHNATRCNLQLKRPTTTIDVTHAMRSIQR
ncbi:unnamed protein product [Ceratitis capitata]|uniref:(Mediterranean fruit fly) hypothetical protein n=1 Tax=Ceratitis capitata TaxID=7213 RepID=A0A811VG54_CERCA|nr:unnamed protein product [Ceratitis capitata]